MKTKIAAFVAFTMIGFNAFAGVPHESGGFVVQTAIEIQYVSIGAGIDSKFKNAINDLLVMRKISNQIEYVKESNWGMEGESTVCIQYKSLAALDETMADIEALKKSVPHKYTKVSVKGSCETNTNDKVDFDPRAAATAK